MFKLLSTSNTKVIKGEGKGYKTYILHLAPIPLPVVAMSAPRLPQVASQHVLTFRATVA